MSEFRLASLGVLLISLLLASSSPAYADTKTLTAYASYIMGDGETPSFAEAMALQRAKQTALEEAGTYVQSYTKSVNQDLTKDEIQTLTGGVMQVEVLGERPEGSSPMDSVSSPSRMQPSTQTLLKSDQVAQLSLCLSPTGALGF